MSSRLLQIPLVIGLGFLLFSTSILPGQDPAKQSRSATHSNSNRAPASGSQPSLLQSRRSAKQEVPEEVNSDFRRAALPSSMKLAASACRASTVTIRVDRNPELNQAEKDSQKPAASRSVAVFSGVLVKQGFVATPLFLPNSKKPQVRITLPNGEQTVGKPRILDEYSGLAIISIKDHTIPCLRCCKSSEPEVGDWVVSGAAWGRQRALVSLGMISGIGYRLPNSIVEPPPMIVCDIRAAQTSKGSGIVASNGKLVGIVMAVSNDGKWTYAVPSSHIHRLLRSLASHQKRPDAVEDEILVLKRQTPRMGIGIDSIWDAKAEKYDIIVNKVVPDGPVDQAGIRIGDRINSVNGKVVRAWYDVVRDISNRQPGDKVKIGIIRDDIESEFKVVLGGGFAASGDNILRLSEYIKPEIELNQQSGKRIAQRNERNNKNQLLNYSEQNLSPPDSSKTSLIIDELLRMLELERAKNRVLEEKMDVLEAKLDRLFKQIEK